MTRSVAALACCVLFAGALHAAAVHAQATSGFRIALRARASAGCSSAQDLTKLVEARAGRPALAADGSAELQVEVAIDAQADGYRALVSIRDRNGNALGQRELIASGACSALDDMLTLVIASSVGVAPAALGETERPPDPTPPAPEPEPEREPQPPPPARSESDAGAAQVALAERASPPVPWSLDIEASGRALTGVLPRPSGGASLSVFAGHGSLGLAAAATWLPPVTVRAQSALRLRSTGVWGELDLCGRAAQAWSTEIWFCAGFDAGALHADAERLWLTTPRWDALVQAAPNVRARISLADPVGLSLAAGATIPLVFPRYSYLNEAGEATLYHAVELGLYAELGLWIRVGS